MIGYSIYYVLGHLYIPLWIAECVKCEHCAVFVGRKGGETPEDPVFGCGIAKSGHPGAPKGAAPTGFALEWSSEQHTEGGRTDAFGRMGFVDEDGTRQPDFVGVADDCREGELKEAVVALLESGWRLPKPNLMMSVAGGAGVMP